jgi:hypothetical protein
LYSYFFVIFLPSLLIQNGGRIQVGGKNVFLNENIKMSFLLLLVRYVAKIEFVRLSLEWRFINIFFNTLSWKKMDSKLKNSKWWRNSRWRWKSFFHLINSNMIIFRKNCFCSFFLLKIQLLCRYFFYKIQNGG